MPEGVIQENELIQLDGTINKLISQLEGLNETYSKAAESIKRGAESISRAMQSMSGATREGRKNIDESAAAADRLERAERELAFALSETGKQVAILKSETAAVNRGTVEHKRQLDAAIGSYDKIKADVKELTALYKALSTQERSDAAFGEQIVAELKAKNAELKELGNAIKPAVEQMTKLQKAEQELAYWQSEEGQRLLEVKKQIREITASRKQKAEVTDDVTRAQQRLEESQKRLADVQNRSKTTADELNIATKYNIELAKAQAKANATEEGSYDNLQAKFALANIELRRVGTATEESRMKQQELINTVANLRAQMQVFNEATGNYAMSVGKYTNVWTGLGFQVQQVVRELPAATVSLNTFFLAISNNIPMLVDEIRKLKKAGESIAGITKGIIKSLFSWQTALVVALAVFSKFGKQIIEFVSDLFTADTAVNRLAKALKNIKKEIASTNGSYGKNIITLRRLGDEYKTLKTQVEKEDWIKKHKSDWQQLNVAMDGVSDADNLFIKNTEAVRKAFSQRARAAAAYKLAQDKYTEIIKEEEKKRQVEEGGVEAYTDTGTMASPQFGGITVRVSAKQQYDFELKQIDTKISKLEAEANAYFDLGNAAEDAAKKVLGEYENEDKTGLGGRDITKYIETTRKQVTEKTENAITKMQISEYKKREAEAIKTYHAEVNALQNTYNENQRILTGYYKLKKALTPEQRKALEDMQTEITSTMKVYKDVYDKTLQDIATDQKIGTIQLEEENLQNRLAFVKEGSKSELELRKQSIENRMNIELLENSKLIKEEQKDEELIRKKYSKEVEDLEYEHQANLLNIKLEGLQLYVDAGYLSLQESLDYTLKMIDVEEEAAILANAQLAKELQQSESQIRAYYAKMRALAEGDTELAAFRVGQTEEATSITNNISRGGKIGAKTAIKYGAEGSRKRQVYEIDKQILDIEKQLSLYYQGKVELSAEELANLELQLATLDAQKKKLTGFKGFIADVGDVGISGAILSQLGFDDEAISAFNNVKEQIVQNLSEITQAEIDAAEAAVEAAQQRVEAAQSVYDAEIEARNNGYANNVETARKELDQEKKNEQAKQKMLEEAQRKQEALNTVTQASSLITAAAQLWSTMASIPIVGPALAIAAIATMFGSFAFAKVRAKQAASQQYGEGGLEFLEGGSHASGNDIDLHTKNRKGKNIRAEGGEAMAIINRRNSKRYKNVLPDVIDSLNKGTFEEKYLKAFEISAVGNMILSTNSDIDLSKIEKRLEGIYEQNSKKTQIMPNGTTITYYKNIRRISRNS